MAGPEVVTAKIVLNGRIIGFRQFKKNYFCPVSFNLQTFQMKKLLGLIVIFQLVFLSLVAQNGYPAIDKSPMDMAYFPVGYPVLKIQDKATDPVVARVIYSRPSRGGRAIFNGLVKNGEVWRLGANEATEIQFFQTVHIDGKKIRSGRYTLYAIVKDNAWTIIFNKENDTWGSFKYDTKKDVLRTDVNTQKTDALVENLSMVFEKTATGCNLNIAWENTKVSLPITF